MIFATPKTVLLAIIAVYFGIMLLLYIFQRHLVFQPDRDDIYAGDLGQYEPFAYTTSDGVSLKGLWQRPRDDTMPVILYFHGNASNILRRFYKAQYFLDRGYGVAFVAYHGYNGATGTPSESNLYADGRAALQAILAQGIPASRIILYGESLGTGVATQIASETPGVKALVLEAPFTSIPEVAASLYWYFPARFLVRDKFNSAQKIGALQMPVLIVHGTKDMTVPFTLGQKLFSLVTSPQKQFVALEGAGHQDIYNFSADRAVDDFIKSIY